MPGRTTSVAFLGNDADLNAVADRVAAKLRTTATVAEESNAKIAASAEAAGAKFGAAFDAGTSKAAAGLSRFSTVGATFGLPMMGSLDAMGKKLDETTAKHQKLLGVMSEVGKVTVGAGLAGFAAAAYEGVKGAMQLQSSMEMLHTQAGATNEQVRQLTKGVEDMAGKVGIAPNELSKGLYHVVSSMNSVLPPTQRVGKELEALKVAAEGAKVGHANLEDVTNALGAAIATGIPGVQNYTQAMGMLNATVGAGDMKMQDLAEALGGPMLATVKGYGLSMRDVGAALATMGDLNIRGADAATQLRMAVQYMAQPAGNGAKVLERMGLSAHALADSMRSGGLIGALQLLHDKMQAAGVKSDQVAEVMTAAFGHKGASGITILENELERVKGKFQAVGAGAGSFGQSWAGQQSTLKQKMDQLSATVQALGDKFGSWLIPKLTALAGAVSNVIHWFEKHKSAAEALGIAIGGPLAASVTVFAGAKMLAMVEALGKGVLAIGGLARSAVTGAATIVSRFTAVGAGAGTMATEVTAADEAIVASADATATGVDAAMGATGVGAVVVGVGVGVTLLATHWQDAMNAIASITQSIVNGVIGALNGLIGALNSVIQSYDSSPLGQIFGVGPVGTIGKVNFGSGGGGGGGINAMGGMVAAYPGGPMVPLSQVASSFNSTPLGQNYNPLSPVGNISVPLSNIHIPGMPTGGGGGGGADLSSLLGGTGSGSGSRGRGSKSNVSYTPDSFAVAALLALGIVPTPANVRNFTAWEKQEGGNWSNNAAFNPLNTTMQEPGGKSINSAGVKAYSSWTEGLKATVSTLKLPAYNTILGALSGGASPGAFSSTVSGSPWGTGAVNAAGDVLSASAIQALENQVGSVRSSRSFTAATSTIPAAVATMLSTAQALVGTNYTWGGGHAGWDPVAELKKIGVDCSGFVSAVLHSGGVSLSGPQTTEGLASSLRRGQGQFVTVWDRSAGAQNQQHTLIDILGKWFESGGIASPNGVSQITARQAAQELAGGGFNPYNPGGLGGAMATPAQLRALGLGSLATLSTTTITSTTQANIQQLIQQMIAGLVKAGSALLTKLGNAIQTGTLRTLESTLGVSTGGTITTTRTHDKWWWGDPWRPYSSYTTRQPVSSVIAGMIHGLGTSASISGIDTTLGGLVGQLSASSPQQKAFNQTVASLRATGQGGLADALVAAHKAAMATLAQQLYAQQLLHDNEITKVQTTELKDQTTLLQNSLQAQLNVTKAGYQLTNDIASAQLTQIQDQTQILTDRFSAMVTAVQDATQQMVDATDMTVQGLNDQTQIQVDLLGERGLYGLNLVAQKLQVQLDVTKAYYDQQIALAQRGVDIATSQAHFTEAIAQQGYDQTKSTQDLAAAAAQQQADRVTMIQLARIQQAQAKLDALTLHLDVTKIGPAQTALDLMATAPKSIQDVLQRQLDAATGGAGLQEARAGLAYQQVYGDAQAIIAGADQIATSASSTAQQVIANANQSLQAVIGQGNLAVANAQQGLTSVKDAALLAQTPQENRIGITKATASTQFAGTGSTINIYGADLSNPSSVRDEVSWAFRTQLQVPA